MDDVNLSGALDDFPYPLEPAGNHELVACHHFTHYAIGAREETPTRYDSTVFLFGVANAPSPWLAFPNTDGEFLTRICVM